VTEGLDKDLEDKISKIADDGFAQAEAPKSDKELVAIAATSLASVLIDFDKLISMYMELSGLRAANDLFLKAYKDDDMRREIAENQKDTELKLKIVEIEMVRRIASEPCSKDCINTEYINSVLGNNS
jgi:hypothetical protein